MVIVVPVLAVPIVHHHSCSQSPTVESLTPVPTCCQPVASAPPPVIPVTLIVCDGVTVQQTARSPTATAPVKENVWVVVIPEAASPLLFVTAEMVTAHLQVAVGGERWPDSRALSSARW
jgi:hypothetical protein